MSDNASGGATGAEVPDTTDGTDGADQSGRGRAEPGSRGRLTVADRVASRIATEAVKSVNGVVPSGSGLQAVIGHQLPDVRAEVAGDRARLEVDVAVRWGTPVAALARQVQEQVRDQLQQYAGLTADRVDVTVAAVEPRATPSAAQERRVR